jgi:hypothetical protein
MLSSHPATSSLQLTRILPQNAAVAIAVLWWRLERTVQRPTSNAPGGRGAVATKAVWSNRPLTHQARLLDHPRVLLP